MPRIRELVRLVATIMVGLMLSACGQRPAGDVCHQKDDLSMFMCESSKNIFKGARANRFLAFYVSGEFKERAVPNLTETLLGLVGSSSQIDIGGKDSMETKKVVLGAIENLIGEEVKLNGVQVMYLGPASHRDTILASFRQLGAKILYVEYEP